MFVCMLEKKQFCICVSEVFYQKQKYLHPCEQEIQKSFASHIMNPSKLISVQHSSLEHPCFLCLEHQGYQTVRKGSPVIGPTVPDLEESASVL